jgi:hypothetical protein
MTVKRSAPSRRNPPGFMGVPTMLMTLSAMLLGSLFVLGHTLGPGLHGVGVAALGLLSLAAALFLTIPELPEDRPALRRVAAVLLAAGGMAVVVMTPFGALALNWPASR